MSEETLTALLAIFLSLLAILQGAQMTVVRLRLRYMTGWKDYWEKEARRVNKILYDQLGIDTDEDEEEGAVGEE